MDFLKTNNWGIFPFCPIKNIISFFIIETKIRGRKSKKC
jgi:hypothetical protein